MRQVLLTDCMIIADSHKSYEKANLHFVNDKIENIYFDKRKPQGIKEISLEGFTVLPDIFLKEADKIKLKALSSTKELYRDSSISTLIDDVFGNDYLLLDADKYNDKFLDFATKVIDRDRLIILTKDPEKILKAAFDYSDALSYLVLNAYKALGYPDNMGKLWRGAKADFILVKDDNIKLLYREGRIFR